MTVTYFEEKEMPSANVIIMSAKVFTSDEANPFAEAVAASFAYKANLQVLRVADRTMGALLNEKA